MFKNFIYKSKEIAAALLTIAEKLLPIWFGVSVLYFGVWMINTVVPVMVTMGAGVLPIAGSIVVIVYATLAMAVEVMGGPRTKADKCFGI